MKNFINNKWMDSNSKKINYIYNSNTKELIGDTPLSNFKDVEMAIEYSYINKNNNNMSFDILKDKLKKFSQLIDNNKEELLKVYHQESGLNYKDSFNEISNLSKIIDDAIFSVHKLNNKSFIENESIIYSKFIPVGVVVLFLPNVNVLTLFVQKVASLLLTGNNVIVKSPSLTPLTITKLVKYLNMCNFKKGSIQLIHGDGQSLLNEFVKSNKVELIDFTSDNTKNIINNRKIIAHKEYFNYFLVESNYDIELAVDAAIKVKLYKNGQSNISPDVFLIHKSIRNIFMKKLIAKLRMIKKGMSDDINMDISSLVSVKKAKLLENNINILIDYNGVLIEGGERIKAYYTPTIMNNSLVDKDKLIDFKLLGPLFSIVEYSDINEIISLINLSKLNKNVYVYTTDLNSTLLLDTNTDANIFANEDDIVNIVNKSINNISLSKFIRRITKYKVFDIRKKF